MSEQFFTTAAWPMVTAGLLWIALRVMWKLLSSTQSPGDIFEAAEGGDIERLRTMVRTERSLIDTVDEDLKTPLHLTAENEYFECSMLLLKSGADPLSPDKLGKTPYAYALESENVALVLAFAMAVPHASKQLSELEVGPRFAGRDIIRKLRNRPGQSEVNQK